MNELSPKETKVLELQAQGLSPEQIGRELLLSPHTVRVHLENARIKQEHDYEDG